MNAYSIALPATFFPQGGPTFFHYSGSCSTIDHLVVPRWFLGNVRRYFVAWRSGRRLQLIPSGSPRDHMPVMMCISYHHLEQFSSDSRPASVQQWCRDSLADSLQYGHRRAAFMYELEAEFAAKGVNDVIRESSSATHPDRM